MIEICPKETGKSDNYLISLGPFHIAPAPLMSGCRLGRKERGREMEQEREGEEERQHRGVFAEKRDGSGMKASQ